MRADTNIDTILRDLITSLGPTPALAMLIDREGRLLAASGHTTVDTTWTAALVAHELETNTELEATLLRGGGVRVDCAPHVVHVRVVAERAVLVMLLEGADAGDPASATASVAPALGAALGHLPALGERELRQLFRN